MQEQYDNWVSSSMQQIMVYTFSKQLSQVIKSGAFYIIWKVNNNTVTRVEVAIIIENREVPEGSPEKESNGSFF